MSAPLDAIRAAVGPGGFSDTPADIAPFLREHRGLYQGETALFVQPASTEAVAKVVSICAQAKIAIVPQGGNTGLVGGQIPFPGDHAILLNLSRMNKVRALDPDNDTITVEAGCTLAALQQAAEAADRLFPLSLASEGSCQIGGNISTNAGGNAVLRYGNMRDLVLGIEAVLPDGRIWNGLRGLRKDNTGYDLKQLFIGGEGTLGIVTAAVCKLFPRPRTVATALVAVPDVAAAVSLFGRLKQTSGDRLTAFELIPRIGIDFVTRHIPGARDPLTKAVDWYVLAELSSAGEEDLRHRLEAALAATLEEGLASDAAIAESGAQASALWALRENLSDVQKLEGGSIKHDISVPISAIPAFITEASKAVTAALPGIRPVPFGHIGDGNVHFNLSQPPAMDRDAFLDRWAEFNRIVHDIAAGLGGSISAEHGLGFMKRDEITHYKSAVEIDMMRAVKRALDPQNIMNP
ncbi:MAG TPA: hydroxyacid dehydrogenase, partial [Alphaproteobacteria bacterium]|nr:hydroxyacid dehydrogenase [Alphaproteobacteria bacterium]